MATNPTNNMKFTPGKIEGLWIIEPQIFGDERGYFLESFRWNLFQEKTGFRGNFVQDNESLSSKGVLRGLHFQKPPMAQAKLVRVVHGAVLDVVVDLRKNSPTYGQSESILLDAKEKKIFFIPVGFAHGFQTLEDNTLFQYKCSNYYSKEHEMGLMWNDESIQVSWIEDNFIISEKDQNQLTFREFESPFD
jgi:dTDP-4-dehydrorhamnose 3,5-epimerase